jgi:hypothetical protein
VGGGAAGAEEEEEEEAGALAWGEGAMGMKPLVTGSEESALQ